MTYSNKETSVNQGNPIELYKFSMSPLFWYYNNSTEDVDYNTKTYKAANIARGKIVQTEEINRTDLRITVPRDFLPADRFRVTPSSEPMLIEIFRTHGDDSEVINVWQGRVISVSWEGAIAVLSCEPIFSSLRRPGLNRYYTYICSHSLYGSKCRVIQENFKTIASNPVVSGSDVTSSDFGTQIDGWFNGGYIEYTTVEALVERVMILTHVGDVITLTNTPAGLQGGVDILAFPGCAHTTTVCEDKYDNLDNYGGFPYIPDDSPFNGKTIF